MSYAKLNKNWLLRGWKDAPKVLVNRSTGFIRPLDDSEFFVVKSCDGRTDFDSFLFLPEHLALRDTLSDKGIVELLAKPHPIADIQQYRKAENPRLDGIQWCVTGLCNLKCKHCYMESTAGRYGMLSLREMTDLIRQFKEANVAHVILTGGEPFMRDDLLNIIKLLAENGIGVSQIYSNGLLVTDAHLKAIRDLGYLPTFQISFDGVGCHDYMRGTKGVEKRVIASIQNIMSYGYPVIVATSIDRINCDSLEKTYDLIKSIGAKHWRVSVPQKTGNWRHTKTAISIEDSFNKLTPLLGRWLTDDRPFDLQFAGFLNGHKKKAASFSSVSKENFHNFSIDSFDCESCRQLPNLLPDGTLVPCPGYVDSPIQESMPNLLHEELSAVWSISSLRELLDIRKDDILPHNPECSACDLFPVCGMGCRAMALTETGNIQSKDPISCQLWKRGFKKIFEEKAASSGI